MERNASAISQSARLHSDHFGSLTIHSSLDNSPVVQYRQKSITSHPESGGYLVWKKTDMDDPRSAPETPAQPRPAKRETESNVATIGPSIKIKGNLSGNEDLVIQGRIDGEILLKQNQVTVGKSGKVKADIHGKSIHVEGEVRGDLVGSEEVIIRASGKVQGNIVAPRVTLDNGSKFKGSIDMEPIIKAAEKAGVAHCHVEQDQSPNPIQMPAS